MLTNLQAAMYQGSTPPLAGNTTTPPAAGNAAPAGSGQLAAHVGPGMLYASNGVHVTDNRTKKPVMNNKGKLEAKRVDISCVGSSNSRRSLNFINSSLLARFW